MTVLVPFFMKKIGIHFFFVYSKDRFEKDLVVS